MDSPPFGKMSSVTNKGRMDNSIVHCGTVDQVTLENGCQAGRSSRPAHLHEHRVAPYDPHLQEGSDLGEDKDMLEASQLQRHSQDSHLGLEPQSLPQGTCPPRGLQEEQSRLRVQEAGVLGKHLGGGTHGARGEKSPHPGALQVTKCL